MMHVHNYLHLTSSEIGQDCPFSRAECRYYEVPLSGFPITIDNRITCCSVI